MHPQLFPLLVVCLLSVGLPGFAAEKVAVPATPPNIVLIFCDDLGYGDLSCYGNSRFRTPHLDQLAKEGIRFTDFYVAQAVCSASRAALLTGCYPNRIGILGALGPKSRTGIHSNELTIAELLKTRGYATAIYGKWHLGDDPRFLPTRHGFDEYFGLPYSNDMWPKHPTATFPDLPLIENEQVVELNPDQRKLTGAYTQRAVKFIEKNRAGPFFLYLAHSMPHVPLFASGKFEGKTGEGLYADVISEIDWSVGEILRTLKEQNIDRQTLVVFTSDNGPWLSYGNHAGSAGSLREGKMTTFEGGMRVPCIMKWIDRIPAGKICREPARTMDLLPTFAALAGAELPGDRKIDGKDISPLLFERGDVQSSPFYYYWAQQLRGVRSGPWKLHLPHTYLTPAPPGSSGKPGQMTSNITELALYDLENDPGEKKNLVGQHPEIVQRLQRLLDDCRADLGDSETKRQGKNVRQSARISSLVTQDGDGSIILQAADAGIHGLTVRYESEPHKNTIGYWTRAEDWVSWDFEVKRPGWFNVEMLQGCANNSAGSELEITVAENRLNTTVAATGGFQYFVTRPLSKIRIPAAGRHSLSVRPKTKAGLAVMDLRAVTLRPAPGE